MLSPYEGATVRIKFSAGVRVWRKASVAFPDSSSVFDKFLSAIGYAPEQFKSRYVLNHLFRSRLILWSCA